MKILAIETSCDDTSVAIVEDGKTVISHTINTQIELHNLTGGVIPEVAAREHAINIVPMIKQTVENANLKPNQIDYIAITYAPGMINSLIPGVVAAQVLSKAWEIPVIPVHHKYGHIASTWLDREYTDFQFPILILTVSGGHTDLIYLEDYCKLEVLGKSLDDAAGEAFDKVARMLGLPYPGGPHIERHALDADPEKAPVFPIANTKGKYDFSFSGLKTAVKQHIKKVEEAGALEKELPNIAYGFQEAVFDALIRKLKKATDEYPVKEIHLVGGVSANKCFRKKINETFPGLEFKTPMKMAYCMDNAPMIAAACYHLFYKYKAMPVYNEVIIPSTKDSMNDYFDKIRECYKN